VLKIFGWDYLRDGASKEIPIDSHESASAGTEGLTV